MKILFCCAFYAWWNTSSFLQLPGGFTDFCYLTPFQLKVLDFEACGWLLIPWKLILRSSLTTDLKFESYRVLDATSTSFSIQWTEFKNMLLRKDWESYGRLCEKLMFLNWTHCLILAFSQWDLINLSVKVHL